MTMLGDRAIVRISGEDVRGFLQGLVTQDLHGPLPAWAGLLSPQGKALFDFILWPAGEDILIDCEAAQAAALARRLTLYRLRRPITIAADPTLSVHWSLSDAPADAPLDPRLAALGRRWLASPDDRTVNAAWRAHRLALGVTEGVGELGDGQTLWLECNARELNGVSFTKGCYVGQENTARMHHRSKVNRRLFVVPIGPVSDRTRTSYPECGLMVEHRRVEDPGDALRPAWLEAALTG